MAFAATMLLEAVVLLAFLYNQYRTFSIKQEVKSFSKMMVAGALMAVAAFTVRNSLVQYEFIHLETFLEVFTQLVVSTVAGIVIYLLASLFLKLPEFAAIKALFGKRG